MSVKKYIDRNKELKEEKQVWNNHWQTIAEFFLTRRANFTTDHVPGEFVNSELFDFTGAQAAYIMAASLIGALWPNGATSFLVKPAEGLPDTHEIKTYYEQVTQRMARFMDDPKSGLGVALEEYMIDQVVFGTSGIAVLSDREDIPVYYRAWDIKRMGIDEGRNGFIDTAYFEEKLTLRKVVQEYGLNNLSEHSQKMVKAGKLSEKISILRVIEPRENIDPNKEGALNKPYRSVHIELDQQKLLKESGYDEMPVKIARFSKIAGEKYGRSPAMLALPDVITLNAIWEDVLVALEKQLKPPLAVLDDGSLGSTKINTGPNGVNVFNTSGRVGADSPIMPLYTVGDPSGLDLYITKLEEAIAKYFAIDRLLDLNNEVQMTLGEANIRNNLRQSTLRPLFTRQIAEALDPMIQNTFNILLEKGELGVEVGTEEEARVLASGRTPIYIPEEVAKRMETGEDVYEIEYFSPAVRAMQAEEAMGIRSSTEYIGAVANFSPEATDIFNVQEAIKRFTFLAGAPSKMLHDERSAKQAGQARAEAMEQQGQMDAARGASEVARNFAQAQNTGGADNEPR